MLSPLRPNPPRDLFDPPPATPAWETLPEPIRREAVEILTRMIREWIHALNGASAGREVGNE